MRRPLFVITAALLWSAGLIPCLEGQLHGTSRSEQPGCTTHSLIEGRGYRLLIPGEQISESPAWALESGVEPPVSVGQASRVAIAEFNRYMSDRDDWILDMTSLNRICNGEKWAYTFSWLPKDRSVVGSVNVIVLMSGEAISLESLLPEKASNEESVR